MALLNPLYACVVPFLLITTIPLAIFAGITTTFAFSILIFRVFVVYLDIALSLVSQSLAHLIESSSGFITSTSKNSHLRPLRTPSSSSSINSRANSVSPSASSTLLKRHRRRRPSSSVYSGTATPGSDIGLGLIPSVGAERDFEGVGGWRLGDDDDNDAAWTTINSRSELLHDRSHDRHHRRTLSGGPTSTSAESGFLMMKGRTRSPEKMLLTTPSPNSSRVRAPSAAPRLGSGANNHSDEYFPLMTYSKAVKRNLA